MEKKTVYIETSVVSYLTARPTRDLLAAAGQKIIAVSAVHGIDYLLTWNYRHLDNAETKPVIRNVCAAHGYNSPEICTPQELMGVFNDA